MRSADLLYRVGSLVRCPVTDGSEFVYCRNSRVSRRLPSRLVGALLACQQFEPVAAHRSRIQHALGIEEADAVGTFDVLVREGFLVPYSSVYEQCAKHEAAPNTPPRISLTGIITRDRPSTLARSLGSFMESCRVHGRSMTFLVSDDSANPATRQEYGERLKHLRHQYGFEILYAGFDERQRFARALAEHVPPDVVQFGLLGPPSAPRVTGANRNTVLLASLGRALFCADDDIFCRVARVPHFSRRRAFYTGHNPAEVWFYPSREAALAAVHAEDTDMFALHEALLGRTLRACVLNAAERGELSCEIDYRFLRDIEQGHGRVLVTLMGLVGDCGVGAPKWLWLDSGSRGRLMASREQYETAFTSREVVTGASCETISSGTHCMAGAVGMDNTQLLPPFLPIGRNQDGVFGMTLRKCHMDGYFGHVPWVILHAPDQTRRFARDAMYLQATRWRLADLLGGIVESAMPASSADPCRAMKALGRFIRDLGEMDLQDFEEFVMIRRVHRVANQISQMTGRLRSDGDPPEFWTRDVERYLDALTTEVVNASYVMPVDLDLGSPEETRKGLQRVVRQFGELVWWWPEVVQATRGLNQRGVQLAVPMKCVVGNAVYSPAPLGTLGPHLTHAPQGGFPPVDKRPRSGAESKSSRSTG